MITANKIAITIRDIVLLISKREVDGEPITDGWVGARVGADDGKGVGLKGLL